MPDSDQNDLEANCKPRVNADPGPGPWYRGGLAFQCTECGQCCSGPKSGFVWVDDAEIQRLANDVGMADTDAFERKFIRRVGNRKSLVEYSDGDCIFLDPQTRRCGVYKARPSQCRTWPFWPANLSSPSAWGRVAQSCPGCNQGRVYSLQEIGLLARSQSQT